MKTFSRSGYINITQNRFKDKEYYYEGEYFVHQNNISLHFWPRKYFFLRHEIYQSFSLLILDFEFSPLNLYQTVEKITHVFVLYLKDFVFYIYVSYSFSQTLKHIKYS